MSRRMGFSAALLGAVLIAHTCTAQQIDGELRQWHKVTLTFEGPYASEAGTPNPFLDYRLVVFFSKGSKTYAVPGYFAADGNAAETGATEGNRWRVHFVPDEPGRWSYYVTFRHGRDVAVSLDPEAGTPMPPDGTHGTFVVLPTDKTGRDHRARGRLQYTGERYLRYAGSGEPFLMVGTQSPENFLAYYEFDNTKDHRGAAAKRMAHPDGLHHYEPHLRDWRAGDPTWRGGKGKAIIGALNYLASKGMNTFYTLTMNVGGDGYDIYPWITPDQPTRYDVSKLDQWEIVFSHMDTLGLHLILVTQEEENEQLLGKLTTARKLYYRELIARFSHHHALTWDIGEEIDRWRYFTEKDIKEICQYIRALDPYDHPIQYVQWKAELMDDRKGYARLLGFPFFDAVGMQHDPENTHHETIKWVERSTAAGHPWLARLIEMNPGVPPDADDYWHPKARKLSIWGNLMAGGSGTIFFFIRAHDDLNCEDLRSRDHLFDLMRYAHEFFTAYLPFAEMQSADQLTPNPTDYVFALPGQVYAIYLPEGGTTELDLRTVSGTFSISWYNPRLGGPLQRGSLQTVRGGGVRSLGFPPSEPDQDWVILVRRVS